MSAARRSLDEVQLALSGPKRPRARPARAPRMALARGATHDDSAPSPRADGLGFHGIPRLDELILEIVRREVRAEVARVAAIAPALPKYVSVAEYAAARSISVSTVRNAIRTGRLPAIRFGAAVRVPADIEIGKPIAANTNRHAPSPAARAEQIVAARRPRSSRSDVDEATVGGPA